MEANWLTEIIRKGIFIILQGGMGVGISSWWLARSVALAGGVGTVSGTALPVVLVRRLQDGDVGGHMLRALKAFPFQRIAMKIYEEYYIPGGKKEKKRYVNVPMFTVNPSRELIHLTVAANFCEVWLAKEGHNGKIGINYLEKIQMPHIFSFFGAMLAGVDFVAVGAGLPVQFPKLIDDLMAGKIARYLLDVEDNADSKEFFMEFTPREFFPDFDYSQLKRPLFFPIISLTLAAKILSDKLPRQIDAWIIEDPDIDPISGGHHAKPRKKGIFNEKGEPIYSLKDRTDLEAIKKIGIPFFLAGGFANPRRARMAFDLGACGTQDGSMFALSTQSGMEPSLRKKVTEMVLQGKLVVLTNPKISSSGYPFGMAEISGTLSDPELLTKRNKICDLGYLRTLYVKPSGGIGYRCPAESITSYIAKGGKEEDTEGKGCLCNFLMVNAGLGQICFDGTPELAGVTMGKDLDFIPEILGNKENNTEYTVEDAIKYTLQLI